MYMFSSIGCFSIWRCLVLLLLPSNFAGKTQKPNSFEYLQNYSRVLGAIAKAWQYLKQHFGVAGSCFLIKSICFELLEISLQSLALFRYAASEDVVLTIATCALLFLNCVLSSIAYAFEKKDVVVVLDGLFDIGYTMINAIRISMQKKPIDAIATLALMLPICSIIDIMASYARFSLRETVRRSDRRVPKRSISRRSSLLLRLPDQKVGSDTTESHMFKQIYRVLQALLAASALTFGAFSGYTLTRCTTKHIECLDKYSHVYGRAHGLENTM